MSIAQFRKKERSIWLFSHYAVKCPLKSGVLDLYGEITHLDNLLYIIINGYIILLYLLIGSKIMLLEQCIITRDYQGKKVNLSSVARSFALLSFGCSFPRSLFSLLLFGQETSPPIQTPIKISKCLKTQLGQRLLCFFSIFCNGVNIQLLQTIPCDLLLNPSRSFSRMCRYLQEIMLVIFRQKSLACSLSCVIKLNL